MKKIWRFLRDHARADFHPKHYLTIIFILAFGLIVNYSLDLEDRYLESLDGVVKFLAYFLLYTTLYLAAVVSYCHWHQKKNVLNDPRFWTHAIFGLAVLSLDSSMPYLYPVLQETVPASMLLWTFKVAINMISFFTVFLPIILFYFFAEKSDTNVYGLAPKKFDVRPYFIMLLIMLPLIIAASHNQGFLRQYPMYKSTAAHTYLGVDEWVTVMGYEVAYGLDFITVELLFRGFFVLGMAAWLGRGAVLTMAVIYCSLHFGKPLGEAVSSIFGGFILGAVAYETRGMWGGVIVHMGIAWMMELVAYLRKADFLP